MSRRDLTLLPSFSSKPDKLNVVIECPRGSNTKLNYKSDLDSFTLSYVMPAGISFPYAFGFIPSTRAADGDPLDVLVLMNAATCTGCILTARPIGVIEGNQTENEKTFRNDRLVSAAEAAPEYRDVRELKEVGDRVLDEIEHFFISYNQMRGRQFEPLRRAGRRSALKLIGEHRKAFKHHQKKHG